MPTLRSFVWMDSRRLAKQLINIRFALFKAGYPTRRIEQGTWEISIKLASRRESALLFRRETDFAVLYNCNEFVQAKLSSIIYEAFNELEISHSGQNQSGQYGSGQALVFSPIDQWQPDHLG